MTFAPHQIQRIPIDRLDLDPQNANQMPPALITKLTANIKALGHYQPCIVWQTDDGRYQLLDGEQRLTALRELGEDDVECVVWDVDRTQRLLSLVSLNQLRGADHPQRRAALLAELADRLALDDLACWIPEDTAAIEAATASLDFDLEAELARFQDTLAPALEALPIAYSFAVDPADAPVVDAALAQAAATQPGPAARARALVFLAQAYLEINDA